MKKIIVALAFLLPIVSIADPVSDSISVKIDSMFVLQADDPVLQALDNFMAETYLSQNTGIYDSVEVPFPKDTTILFESAYYKAKLEELNANTPFNLTYNKNVEAFIELYVKKRPELTSRLLGLSHMYFPMFEEILDKHDLPIEFKYLAVVESALRPTAKSRAGAAGLWQFMYSTGKMYGLTVNSFIDERMDPYKSTEAACRYFKTLYKMYGNWELVMAAYNCGPGNVNKAIRRSGGKRDYWELWPYLPRETRGYVPAFIAVNYVMNNAHAHQIYATPPLTTYFEYDTVYVKEEVLFSQIAECLDIEKDIIKKLNPTYKHELIPNSTTPKVLYLPTDKIGSFIENEEFVYTYNEDPEDTTNKAPNYIEEELRKIHIVNRNEYLGGIAQKYNVSVTALKDWNGLRTSRIYPGQKLVIYTSYKPKPTKNQPKINPNSSYYTIQRGDTLWDIAKASGTSVERLKALNSGLNYNRLKPGSKIKIGG